MPRLRRLVASSEAYTSSSSSRRWPANRDRPSCTCCHFSSSVSPGTRLVVAMAPAFTIGFMVRLALSSTAITESKGRPVALTPSRARASWAPIASQTSANTNGFDTLWMEKGTSASPTACTRPYTFTIATPNRFGDASASAGM